MDYHNGRDSFAQDLNSHVSLFKGYFVQCIVAFTSELILFMIVSKLVILVSYH